MNAPAHRRLNTWKSCAWHLVFGGIVGLSVAAIISVTSNIPNDSQIVVGWTNVGALVGFLIWLCRASKESAALRTSRHSENDASPMTENPPASFLSRLAQYIDCDEKEISRPRELPKSRMPFWSLLDFRTSHGPGPTSLIRGALHRIRDKLHGPRRLEYVRRVLDEIRRANATRRTHDFQFSVSNLLLAMAFIALILGCLNVLLSLL